MALGVVIMAVGALGLAGCVETRTVAGSSTTCAQPTTHNDGFFQNRSLYYRVSTQPDPLNAGTTWVCYRIKAPNQPETAGRIDVNPTTATSAVSVTSDLSSRACTTAPGNLVLTPHPIEQGEVLDTPFYIDAFAGLGGSTTVGSAGAWLCVEAAGFKQRLMVTGPGVDEPDVVLNSDPSPGPIVDTTPPPAGLPSSSCAENAFGPSTEHINAHLNGRDLFLYTARPADNEVHICARVSGTPSGGGRLSVKAATSQVVDIRQSSDLSPCTQDVVVVSSPALAIRISPVGQNPPSICVQGTRYTVVTGPVPPVVSFTPDPST